MDVQLYVVAFVLWLQKGWDKGRIMSGILAYESIVVESIIIATFTSASLSGFMRAKRKSA